MPYVAQADIEAVIPGQFLVQALDDDASGEADAGLLDSIIALIGGEIDALIAPNVETPISGVTPPLIKTAAVVLVCDALYRRRGIPDDSNPWSERANDLRDKLHMVGRGEMALDASSAQVAGFTDHTLDFTP